VEEIHFKRVDRGIWKN